MDKKEIFEKAPVHKAVFSMALPTILSMIVIILYNMADTFFVGQTHNSLCVSAVSLASPVFLIFTAFSSMFGAGGSSVISRALGTGEKEKAKRVSALVCYASILFGIIMSAVVLLGMDFILKILGTNMIQAMGKVVASFVLNLLRQGIFLIPLLFILNYFFGLDGVIYSNAIADYGAVIVSYAVCIAYIRKMK